MADDIPQWAAKRALELMRAESSSAMWSRDCYADRALARYIAAHEEAPVDPLMIEARKLVAHTSGYTNSADAILQGKWDGDSPVLAALAALKRGIELAGKQ